MTESEIWQSPISLAELAKAQGFRPLENVDDLVGGWPEDEDIDEFLEAVRQWRRESRKIMHGIDDSRTASEISRQG